MSMTRQLLTTDGPESIYSSTVSELNVTYNASRGQDQSYNAPYSVPSTITIVLLSLCASMITVRVFQVSRSHLLVCRDCILVVRFSDKYPSCPFFFCKNSPGQLPKLFDFARNRQILPRNKSLFLTNFNFNTLV